MERHKLKCSVPHEYPALGIPSSRKNQTCIGPSAATRYSCNSDKRQSAIDTTKVSVMSLSMRLPSKPQEKWFLRLSDLSLHNVESFGMDDTGKHHKEQDDTLLSLALKLFTVLVSGSRRKYFLKVYHDCFTGAEAIDMMIKEKLAVSVQAATQQAQAFLRERYVLPADKGGYRFANSNKRFYRFSSKLRQINSGDGASKCKPFKASEQDYSMSMPIRSNPAKLDSRVNVGAFSEATYNSRSAFSLRSSKLWFRKQDRAVNHDIKKLDQSQFGTVKKSIEPIHYAARQRALAGLLGAFVAEAASTSLNNIAQPTLLIPEFHFKGFDPAFFDATIVNEVCQHKRRTLMERSEQSYFDTVTGLSTKVKESSTSIEARIALHCIAQYGHLENLNHIAHGMYEMYKQHHACIGRAARSFVKNMDKGKLSHRCAVSNNSIDVLAYIPPIVVLYVGTDQLCTKIEEFVRLLYIGKHVLDLAMIAGYILEQIILGASILEALRKSTRCTWLSVRQRKIVYKAFIKSNCSPHEAFQRYGNSGSLPGGIYNILHPLFVVSNYETAVRENIIGGGRSCRRAMFLGACFAAQDGVSCIPSAWIKYTPHYEVIQANIKSIVQQRDFFHMHADSGKENESECEQKRARPSSIHEPKRSSLGHSSNRATESHSLHMKDLFDQETPLRLTASISPESICRPSRCFNKLVDFGDLQQFY